MKAEVANDVPKNTVNHVIQERLAANHRANKAAAR